MDELELVEAADKAGFKYVLGHRAPLPRRVLAPLGQRRVRSGTSRTRTERIHLGSGIFNPLPQVNHPAKVAERVAMLDHLSRRALRVRHRPRRGQPRDPRLPPRHRRTSPGTTRDLGRRDRASSRRCGCRTTYEGYEGKYWSLPPRKILPKPYEKPHPPMWYAAGNTSQLRDGRAQGPRRARLLGRRPRRAGAGARGLQGRRSRTPSRSARSSTTTSWSPSAAFVAEDSEDAVQSMRRRATRRTCRATCSATTTRSRIPTGCRRGPS